MEKYVVIAKALIVLDENSKRYLLPVCTFFWHGIYIHVLSSTWHMPR
jgi:hypothetical protein